MPTTHTIEPLGDNMAATAPKFLSESADKSDLVLICGEKRFPVNKARLSRRSAVFDAMLNGRFREKDQKEITLPDDDPTLMLHLLRYIYNWRYYPSYETPLLQHLQLALLADKYALPKLYEEATKMFSSCAEVHCVLLENKASTELADAIREVYTNDAMTMFRPEAAAAGKIAWQELAKGKETKSYKAFWAVVEESHAFAVDLLRPGSALKRGEKRSRDEEEAEPDRTSKEARTTGEATLFVGGGVYPDTGLT